MHNIDGFFVAMSCVAVYLAVTVAYVLGSLVLG